MMISSYTLLGTNISDISPEKVHFEDDFPFPVWWDMWIPWRVYHDIKRRHSMRGFWAKNIHPTKVRHDASSHGCALGYDTCNCIEKSSLLEGEGEGTSKQECSQPFFFQTKQTNNLMFQKGWRNKNTIRFNYSNWRQRSFFVKPPLFCPHFCLLSKRPEDPTISELFRCLRASSEGPRVLKDMWSKESQLRSVVNIPLFPTNFRPSRWWSPDLCHDNSISGNFH